MKITLSSVLNALESRLENVLENVKEVDNSLNNEKGLINDIKAAREDWVNALNYFEQVDDPELIDYSIYRIEAARRRYMYLLKQARKNGIEDTSYIDQMTRIS